MLLPVVGSQFQAKFVGLYAVACQISDLNYLISALDWREKKRMLHKFGRLCNFVSCQFFFNCRWISVMWVLGPFIAEV